ncbi:acid protease [Dentipellis sp. KUC8613]|nr:acid protease [Dentipellis sp. KUC8613]
MWMASTSCSSSACSDTKGRLYDPSSGRATGVGFDINYLAGDVHGTIYWDQVTLGSYNVDNQAFAAAITVDEEPLENEFDGILGLALPLNSVIAQKIPPLTGNTPDGAAFASNLFSITPVASAPASRFFSLSLSRPDSDEIPSLLGIGRHPSQLVSNPSKITYSTVESQSSNGVLFWQTSVRAITVYADGKVLPITLGRSTSGAVFPSAVLDSGVPFILTTTAIANGIYGALGIGPASDGNYYVPCTTPINMTITLDGQPELPLHPLDLSAAPQQSSSTQSCVGLIQTAGGQLDNAANRLEDMILGVPFLRNTYTVMAYEAPNAQGAFPSHTDSSVLDDESLNGSIHPMIGLLGLTNATKALDEFHTVRVLQKPLTSGGNPAGNQAQSDGSKHVSVGLEVLFGLLGFFGLCVVLFVLRWVIVRRRFHRMQAAGLAPGMEADRKSPLPGSSEFELSSQEGSFGYHDGDEAIRRFRLEEYQRRKGIGSAYTTDSQRTRVGADDGDSGEFGARALKKDKEERERYTLLDPWDPRSSLGPRDTLVGEAIDIHPDKDKALPPQPEHDEHEHHRTDSGASDAELARAPPRAVHQHSPSDVLTATALEGPGVAEPLLAHTRADSRPFDDIAGFDFAAAGGARGSMAGVGTAARGSRIDFEPRGSVVSGGGGGIGRSVSPGMRAPASPLSARFPGLASSDEGSDGRGSPERRRASGASFGSRSGSGSGDAHVQAPRAHDS